MASAIKGHNSTGAAMSYAHKLVIGSTCCAVLVGALLGLAVEYVREVRRA